MNRQRSTRIVSLASHSTLLFMVQCKIASAAAANGPISITKAAPYIPGQGQFFGVLAITGILVVAIPFGLFVYFVKIFNVNLCIQLDEATTKALDKMVRFCYVFMFASFLLLLLPFLILLVLPPGVVGNIYTSMFGSPIAFVVGCVADQNPDHVLWELVCQQPGLQKNEWLINIGGYVWSPTPISNMASADVPPISSLAPSASAAALGPTRGISDVTKNALGGLPSAITGPILERRLAGTVETLSSTAPRPAAAASPTTVPAPVNSGGLSDVQEGWYANPTVGRNFFPMAVVSGGITVPFYFIIVALFGASISMAQKIPEYQAQLAEGVLSPPQIRKVLTIQVLQFVSAPFLAVITYAFFGPTGQTATITVAFVAGFSSQTILTNLMSAMNTIETKSDGEARRVRSNQTTGS